MQNIKYYNALRKTAVFNSQHHAFMTSFTGDNMLMAAKSRSGILYLLAASFALFMFTGTSLAYTLTASVIPTGSATLSFSPEHPDNIYGDGEAVWITATPNAGYGFDSWSGDATGSDNPVMLTMNADKTVTANMLATHVLTTSVNPPGSATISFSPEHPGNIYGDGETVWITATPNTGYTFDSWSGDATGMDNPVMLTMDADKTVTANMIPPKHLQIDVNYTGSGVIYIYPYEPTLMYPSTDYVQLEATSNPGFIFANWSGDLSGTSYVAGLLMDADKNVTANYQDIFAPNPCEILSTNRIGDYNPSLRSPVGPVFDANGDVLVARSVGEFENYDFELAKYDSAGNPVWSRQYGVTGVIDWVSGMLAVPDGGFYVSGCTYGSLDGNPYANSGDAFLGRYDTDGNLIWSKLIGGLGHEEASDVAVDQYGNAYIVGYTYTSLDGNTHVGQQDCFIVKYDPEGNKLWTRMLGTADHDEARAVAVDSNGGVYFTGVTYGEFPGSIGTGVSRFFVAKYDSGGNLSWVRQDTNVNCWGGAYDVAVDNNGEIYVAGDGLVAKYSVAGDLIYMMPSDESSIIGTGLLRAYDIVTDNDGNLYAIGWPEYPADHPESFSYWYIDIGVSKIAPDGVPLWNKHIGTGKWDDCGGINIGGDGNIYITGKTEGEMLGETIVGQYSSALGSEFLMKMTNTDALHINDGNMVTTTPDVTLQLNAHDTATGVADMQISNDGVFDGEPWEAYSSNRLWTLSSGEGVKTLYARFKDGAGNISPAYTDSITLDTNGPPTSIITAPLDGATISGTSYNITGTATDGSGSGVQKVEVSTDGGSTWNLATGTTLWSYDWALAPGESNIRSRATDSIGNVETPGPGINVTVSATGSPESTHYSWDAKLSGGSCTACHSTTGTFKQSGFMEGPGFCGSCHNAAGRAHERSISEARGHSIFVSVTAAGSKTPTYGNITTGEYDNRPKAHLMDGDKVVCVTCHNTMQKAEDVGRAWELTTTSDNLTYTMQNGGWSNMGRYVPEVYRDSSLWTGPTYIKDRRDYLVAPSEYTYDETDGTITFTVAQPATAYIYVTLDYPYLRASSYANRLCMDCHAQATHKGANCLVCHTAHGSDNLKGVRGTVRTTDRSERAVSFTDYSGAGSFADGDASYDGICEVCHTQTMYHRRDATGFVNHSGGMDRAGTNCTTCHSHATGFAK